ncbi:hypothetical protein BV22DRAFT_1133239 [Leucogyrophana mollusca]|uniref:Uncharacterized protein n=1 Tax=Leucogyrophana mollusca TaxID=85980 RepID=A0ACB8B661_9AGAM|nr:hypothetical protein BV22DRAFT_1133239 [Leucogyrophana mollusca]
MSRPSTDPSSVTKVLDLSSTAEETADLVGQAVKVLDSSTNVLDAPVKGTEVSAAKLLKALLDHAPTTTGQRYTANAIIAASRRAGVPGLVTIATGYYFGLLNPMRTRRRRAVDLYTEQIPTFDQTVTQLQAATREQGELRKLLLKRDDNRCVVTGHVDYNSPFALDHPCGLVEAAHIIPYSLNDFQGTTSMESSARTWDILKNWASIDVQRLAGQRINDPSNALTLTHEIHTFYGKFAWCLLEIPNEPHKYKIWTNKRRFLHSSLDVVSFVDHSNTSPGNPGIPLPDPILLRIHAALAQVFHASGAGEYMDEHWEDEEGVDPVRSDDTGGTDVQLDPLRLHNDNRILGTVH